jgi:glucose/arabinose dehydrogenase
MRRSVLGVTVALLALALPVSAGAVTKRLVGNFSAPVQVFAPASVPGSTIYVVEKGGYVIRRQKGGHRNVVLDVHGHVSAGTEQGLLSGVIAGRKLFVYYTNPHGDSRVVRYTLNRRLGHVRPGSRHTVLRQHQPFTNHNGGTLQYRGGHLYLGLGDGGGSCDSARSAQNLHSKLGKLLRKDSHGLKIVGYGLRNPWRWSFDRKTGALYIGDVGQDFREEVDFLRASRVGLPAENYGWNRYEGRKEHTCGANEEPFNNSGDLIFSRFQYGHGAGGPGGEVVVGGFVYRGHAIPGQRGRYFFGDEIDGWLRTADARTLKNRKVLGFTVPHLDSFGENSKGELFAVSLDGPVYKLVHG